MSDARENILGRIQALNLSPVHLPEIPDFGSENDLQEDFKSAIHANKGVIVSEGEVKQFLSGHSSEFIFDTSQRFQAFSTYKLPKHARELDNLEVAILTAEFGVAENGAMWLPDSQLPFRVMPFIAQHLIILLPGKDIVGNMHDAYHRIGKKTNAFGLLIAGPSKTADIEQSLVVGAHGAKSLRVLLR